MDASWDDSVAQHSWITVIPKFGVSLDGRVSCIRFFGHCVSHMLFEGGILNLVYGCIFDAYEFEVTVVLPYDLDSRIIVSGVYLLYYLM